MTTDWEPIRRTRPGGMYGATYGVRVRVVHRESNKAKTPTMYVTIGEKVFRPLGWMAGDHVSLAINRQSREFKLTRNNAAGWAESIKLRGVPNKSTVNFGLSFSHLPKDLWQPMVDMFQPGPVDVDSSITSENELIFSMVPLSRGD